MVTFRDFGMGGGGRRGRQRATPIIMVQRLGIKYLKDDCDTFIDGKLRVPIMMNLGPRPARSPAKPKSFMAAKSAAPGVFFHPWSHGFLGAIHVSSIITPSIFPANFCGKSEIFGGEGYNPASRDVFFRSAKPVTSTVSLTWKTTQQFTKSAQSKILAAAKLTAQFLRGTGGQGPQGLLEGKVLYTILLSISIPLWLYSFSKLLKSARIVSFLQRQAIPA